MHDHTFLYVKRACCFNLLLIVFLTVERDTKKEEGQRRYKDVFVGFLGADFFFFGMCVCVCALRHQ